MKPKFLNSIFRREAVANVTQDAKARESSVANALDPAEAIDFSESADGWFKISPYGVFRGKTPGRPQHVSVENAKAMESEFNSMLGTLGRLFRGIPIYHGHPDVDPEIWPDDRRIGKITQLQARADGLWGFAEWNSLGDQNKAEGWWIYPSPRWDSPVGQTRFTPDRLISIGLTNTPRIEDSEPVFNSELETKTLETTTEPNQPMDPKLIRQKLGLAPEATDEEVIAKLDSVMASR
ncbi:MAG: phage protease [Verrucomicrobiota bacterium]